MLHRPANFTKAHLLDLLRDVPPDAKLDMFVCMKTHPSAPGSTQSAQEFEVRTGRKTLLGEPAFFFTATVWTADDY